ncbi:MAG: GGDEF domain-containing protein, partial [Oscillospiraceae bacterium]|nr:GGDEF domain-containing protein [Oscillospiraceae bacterium]
MKRANRMSVTTKYVLLVSALMLLTNIVLSTVMIHQFRNTIQTLVRRDMLDISNTAAGLLDGDVLGELKEEDVGTPKLEDIRHQLAVFQENVDIEYIYAVRQVGEDDFVFTVDADPVDPADFGEEVLVTYALRQAAKGTAAVDTEPAQDEWGNFYSAYSPVLDTGGRIAGIVGVDFDSAWYESQIREHLRASMLIAIVLVAVSGAVVAVFTQRVVDRLMKLKVQLSALSADVDELTDELSTETGYMGLPLPKSEKPAKKPAGTSPESESDEIEAISSKMQAMHSQMKQYIESARSKAYLDGLTGVGNSLACQEKQESLNREIAEGTADFHVVVLDINDLKKVNDRYGHSEGDLIIRGAAAGIVEAFGREQTFRIGGDELLAIAERVSEDELKAKIAVLDQSLA